MNSPVLSYTKFRPLLSPFPNKLFSLKQFSKQSVCNSSVSFSSHPISPLLSIFNPDLRRPVRCTFESDNPVVENFKTLSLDSVKETLTQLTPIQILKYSLTILLVLPATKWATSIAFNPFTWMYLSFTWLFWPWYIAIFALIYGGYCLRKYLKNEANQIEQVALVTCVFTWLTLVPPAFSNGFLEGWPYVFFFVYHYFFYLNVSVRGRLYGDLYGLEYNPKWDVKLPNWQQGLFAIAVVICHWFAAFEAHELHLLASGAVKLWIWISIVMILFMQYNASLYLAKYSEKVVEPTSVVQYGPYRFVRHHINASTMLLFASYFAALQAPLSVLSILIICVVYYDQKAKIEEALLVENFGWQYKQYAEKVKYKFIPFVY